jgi:hypothetical protein
LEIVMSTLTGLISSGGGGGDAIEQATNNQVLEINKEYWVIPEITVLNFPSKVGISAGAVISFYPSSGTDTGFTLESPDGDIFWNNVLYGAGAGTAASVAIAFTDKITFYWSGFAWLTLPITGTMNTLTNNAYSQLFTSSGSFTVPTDNNLIVTVVGGGGAGGRLNWHGGAGGGGGGSIVFHEMSLITAGTVVTVTVGGGGGATGGTGGAGGTSSFGSYLIANGGGGGSSITSVGAGGTFSGSETITNGVNGGNGGRGESVSHDPPSTFYNDQANGQSVTSVAGTFAGGAFGGRHYYDGYEVGHWGGGGAAGYGGYGYGGRGSSYPNTGSGSGGNGVVLITWGPKGWS